MSGFPDLDPFVEKLKKKHVVGACTAHPGVRCLYHKQTDRHIHLAENVLLFWANALHKVQWLFFMDDTCFHRYMFIEREGGRQIQSSHGKNFPRGEVHTQGCASRANAGKWLAPIARSTAPGLHSSCEFCTAVTCYAVGYATVLFCSTVFSYDATHVRSAAFHVCTSPRISRCLSPSRILPSTTSLEPSCSPHALA